MGGWDHGTANPVLHGTSLRRSGASPDRTGSKAHGTRRVTCGRSTGRNYFRLFWKNAVSLANAMSPLQYQKWLRLNEARRSMPNEHLDVSRAAFAVGYESPSQFSREYSHLFGTPPRRDIATLRGQDGMQVGGT
ncbi:Helix-turn-helix domain protein [compost metagenome]